MTRLFPLALALLISGSSSPVHAQARRSVGPTIRLRPAGDARFSPEAMRMTFYASQPGWSITRRPLAFMGAFGGDVTRFDLSGIVTDSTGAVLPGASVTISNRDTGFSRTTVAGESGRYSFNALPPTGRWTITVELQGFQTQIREGLEFQANSKLEINVQLSVSTVAETVTVNASSPVIRPKESELSHVLDDKQLEDLPTNGRSFMSLLRTSGSVLPTGEGSLNLSINGQGGRMANFLADGVSMTGRETRRADGESGGGNSFSLEVIKELQIITNGFKAETGNTGVGTVSVVTKSGTNTLSGTLYGYWLPTALVADNLLSGASATLHRKQFGGLLSGPIVHDRTHYLANWESTLIDDDLTVTSPLGPGQFPNPQRQHQFFGKVNHRFNDRHLLDARYNRNRNKQENNGVGGLNTIERGSNAEGHNDTFVTSLNSTIGDNKVNEARFRFSFVTSDTYSPLTSSSASESRNPDFSSAPVSISRPGVGNAGVNPALPQNLAEKRAQWVDHFSIAAGRHQWKFGADVIASWRFVTFFSNFAGTYTFRAGTPYPYDAANPATYPFQFTQNFGISGLHYTDVMTGLFAQDDWELTRGVTLNLGVRWDRDTLFQGDNNNVAPRLGFAWDVGNQGKTVVRGNAGIFYDTLESSLINRESNFGPVGQASLDVRAGDPLFPAFPNTFSAFPTGATAVPRAIVYVPVFTGDDFPGSIGDHFQRVAPSYVNANVGIQRELWTDWALSLDYTRLNGRDLLITADINAPPFFAVGPGRTRTAAAADALRPLGVPNVAGGPYGVPFTGFRSLFLQANGGDTQYDGVKVGITKRYSHRYSMQARYTYGKARGNVDNFRLTGAFVPGVAFADGDRDYQDGPSDTDAPHVFVISGLYEIPWGIRVGGVYFAQSGFPYTGIVGTDADGDGVSNNTSYGDRPLGLDRNSFRRPTTVTLDLTAAKTFTFLAHHLFEVRFDVFNVMNRKNVTGINNVIGLNPASPAAGFGTTTSLGAQRQAQVAVRYTF